MPEQEFPYLIFSFTAILAIYLIYYGVACHLGFGGRRIGSAELLEIGHGTARAGLWQWGEPAIDAAKRLNYLANNGGHSRLAKREGESYRAYVRRVECDLFTQLT